MFGITDGRFKSNVASSKARQTGKTTFLPAILLVLGILGFAGSFSIWQKGPADSEPPQKTVEIKTSPKPSSKVSYISALHDAARKLLAELKKSGLHVDVPKLAMWTIGNDTDHYLHDALVEHIKRDNTFAIMDSASVARIEGPDTYEELLVVLFENHGVKGILTGTIIEKNPEETGCRVLVSFSVRSVPDDRVIRQYSAIEGTFFPTEPARPKTEVRLPSPLASKGPKILMGFSVLLILAGIILLVLPDARSRSTESSPGQTSGLGEAKDTSRENGPDGSADGESGQCAALLSLLDEVFPLNSDVMMLARENGLHRIADELLELGAFFKSERTLVEQTDYSDPGIARTLELSPDEMTEVGELDENLCGTLRECITVLKTIYDSLTQTSNQPHGSLAEIEAHYQELQEMTDSVRETFRDRQRILDKDTE